MVLVVFLVPLRLPSGNALILKNFIMRECYVIRKLSRNADLIIFFFLGFETQVTYRIVAINKQRCYNTWNTSVIRYDV